MTDKEIDQLADSLRTMLIKPGTQIPLSLSQMLSLVKRLMEADRLLRDCAVHHQPVNDYFKKWSGE